MKKGKKGRPFGAPQKKEVAPAVQTLLTVEQTEDLRRAFSSNGISGPRDLKDRSCFKQQKSVIERSGFFQEVRAIPGAIGYFEVVQKGSGKVAQGNFQFAAPQDG